MFVLELFKKTIVCFLITPPIFGTIACILLCIAGGVGFADVPFKPLAVVAIIVGVVFLISCVIMVITGFLFFRGFKEKSWFPYFFVIMRLIYGIVWIVAFLSGIILAVGNFSLRTSLDVVFARSFNELENYQITEENLKDPDGWINNKSKSMKSVGALLVTAFVFVVFSGGALVPPSGKSDFAKVIGLTLFASQQLMCGLILFIPLQAFGRDGLALFGFKAVKDGSFTGIYVLSILIMAFSVVTMVLVLLSVKVKPLMYVAHVVGLLGFGISIALIVLAGTVLSQRKKATASFEAFCLLRGADGAPIVPHDATPACENLLDTYSSNLCSTSKANPAEFEECKNSDIHKLDVFVGKFVAATKSWMGWMGFAVMFAAIYSMFFSCGTCVPNVQDDDETVDPFGD